MTVQFLSSFMGSLLCSLCVDVCVCARRNTCALQYMPLLYLRVLLREPLLHTHGHTEALTNKDDKDEGSALVSMFVRDFCKV